MTPGWLNSFLLPYHLLLTVEPVTLLGFLLDLVISAGVGFPSTQQTYCTLHFVPDFPHIVCLFYYASSNYPKEPCWYMNPLEAEDSCTLAVHSASAFSIQVMQCLSQTTCVLSVLMPTFAALDGHIKPWFESNLTQKLPAKLLVSCKCPHPVLDAFWATDPVALKYFMPQGLLDTRLLLWHKKKVGLVIPDGHQDTAILGWLLFSLGHSWHVHPCHAHYST